LPTGTPKSKDHLTDNMAGIPVVGIPVVGIPAADIAAGVVS
jgi:hypothetical protein